MKNLLRMEIRSIFANINLEVRKERSDIKHKTA